jgi:hypothetical protein
MARSDSFVCAAMRAEISMAKDRIRLLFDRQLSWLAQKKRKRQVFTKCRISQRELANYEFS